jgi:hypothetical protein
MFLSNNLEEIDHVVFSKKELISIDYHMERINKAISGLTGLQKVFVMMQFARDFPVDNEEIGEFLRNDFNLGCITDGIGASIEFLADQSYEVEKLFREVIKRVEQP